ncbi:DUF2187 family protein [Solibacillus sp. NPDC093137]|uniref:DUF2187 family protein n=1 Tax=Solibacillus sp. NPDC093137 TaxID=3390678 RepID=UPI003CFC3BFD
MNLLGILETPELVEEKQSKPRTAGRRFSEDSTIFKKKLKKSHAFIGEKILFSRKSHMVKGIVIAYREHSVIVEISQADSKRINIKNTITVVNHKNYELI